MCKFDKKIETKIFKEEGIDVSDNELAALVKQEAKDVKKSEPATSTNEISKSNGVNPSIEKTEDEVIRLANHDLSVMEEDVDISNGSLKQLI